jgi:hypothetical protein
MNLSDVLKYGHLTVLRTIEEVPDGEWETANVCGVWSCKQIMAHLASFEHVLVEVLQGFLGGGPTPTMDRFAKLGNGGFNDFEVGRRDGMGYPEVVAEYGQAHERTMELVAQIGPEAGREPGSLPWYGPEYALDDYICYSYYGHKREHMAQINVFKDVLKSQGKIRSWS